MKHLAIRTWLRGLTLVACGVALLIWTHDGALRGADGRVGGAPQTAERAQKERLREGSRLDDAVGSFKTIGDRYAFIATDGARYVVLENLQLDRISRRVAESPDPLTWTVSGVVTEYSSANYLLVSRAVQRSDGSSNR